MSTLATTRPARRRGAPRDPVGPGSSGSGGNPDTSRRSKASPIPPPTSDQLRSIVRDRLLPVLDEWIAEECRAVVEHRLAGVQPIARATLLPSSDKRAGLADEILARLHPASIAALLLPAIDPEHRLLLELACCTDPMLREAALDALAGTKRDLVMRADIRAVCAALLSPGLALLGAAPSDGPEEEATRTTTAIPPASQETMFLHHVRRGAAEAAIDMLAAHAGIARDRIAQAVWTRDARSLLGVAWRAGYSMRAALLLQTQLAGIPPASAIGPGEIGAIAMGRGEIAWQLSMLDAG